jgi:endoglucanase
MRRRSFLQLAATAASALALPRSVLAIGTHAARLPRWRGFNLLEMFDQHWTAPPFREADFQMISDWGFDFVRLPLSYRFWSDAENPHALNDAMLRHVDAAVEWGRKYGIHMNLNLHRIPGYCVNQPAEPKSLWKDEEAQEAATYQWGALADRYRAVPTAQLSFDLVNEPSNVTEPVYAAVMNRITARIRQSSPDRIVIVDGLNYGRMPVESLAASGVAQSTRGYDPMPISHWGAGWVDQSHFPPPAWPLRYPDGTVVNKETLRERLIRPFQALAARGVGVHVGEWGVYNKTPHAITLAFMRDYLELWKEVGWGWALWNFRGEFGPLDSGRSDVAYEDFKGHKLDRKMLDLLRAG